MKTMATMIKHSLCARLSATYQTGNLTAYLHGLQCWDLTVGSSTGEVYNLVIEPGTSEDSLQTQISSLMAFWFKIFRRPPSLLGPESSLLSLLFLYFDSHRYSSTMFYGYWSGSTFFCDSYSLSFPLICEPPLDWVLSHSLDFSLKATS